MADDYQRYYSQHTSPPRAATHPQTWEYPHPNTAENAGTWNQQGYPQPNYPPSGHLPPYPNQTYQNYMPRTPDYPTGYEPSPYPVVNPPAPPTLDTADAGLPSHNNNRYTAIHRSHTYGRSSSPPERVSTLREARPESLIPPHTPIPMETPQTEPSLQPTYPAPGQPETNPEQVAPIETNSAPLPQTEQKKEEKTIFLEFEQQVKKATLPESPTLSQLGQLFVEKFGCSFEQDKLPPIYVEDKDARVWYELEDVQDLMDKSHLRFHLPAPSESKVDSLQKQVDDGFAMVANELKELKSLCKPGNLAAVIPEGGLHRSNTIAAIGSVDSRLVVGNGNGRGIVSNSSTLPQEKVRQFQNEIRSLRTELSVVKQLYSEYQTEANSMLTNLATSTKIFKEKLEKTPQSSRTVIDAGINKLEQKAISVYDRMHDLQDIIDDMKALVIKNGKPSKFQVDFAFKESRAIAEELVGQRNYVDEVTPGWKKNFEEELKHIISCQEFLKKHQALLNDLEDEHKESQTLLEQLGKILELKAKTAVKPITIDVASIEEKHDVLGNVFQEIACVDPNSDRRMRAMAQSEKLRRWELENKVDEFEAELNDFVGSKKLRKTGGTEELERMREKRNRETLTAMLRQQQQQKLSASSSQPSPPPAQAQAPAPVEAEPNATTTEPVDQVE
ncbi:AIP3-domain-containing protein [Basidiobolus meristosporus CBS 931.73]|uniref:AIP3-domain-containing protein n=1 Tax=Basidiobolus meristosporus CBS 931.73 TaxID=1314790 RepID=A0A1Y1YQ20_9FUNG|nr:AIP3-domain-containing protein [Basidiobolus meristosporus CBS 931.73]|eukprot:ORY00123.1 AIP3-domain-containing protein [Basidiobolus meristosporus CBS 931.73]